MTPMEIEGEDGSKLSLKPGTKSVFGKGNGLNTQDRTVSRRHVLFDFKDPTEKDDSQKGPRVSVEVLGRNPIWIRNKETGGIVIRKKSEKEELFNGDSLCFSSQSPVWFTLKRSDETETETEDEERSEVDNQNDEPDNVDVSDIDPVKEFGFLVIGNEFNQYPKERIRSAKNWDWFLEEPKKKDDEDEDEDEEDGSRKRSRGTRKKKRKGKGNKDEEDDEWTGDSEEDLAVIAKTRRVSKYSTRSKDRNKPKADRKKSVVRKTNRIDEEEEDDETEEEDDETLGGFIVDDVEMDEEEEDSDNDEEEEDSDDDDEEEED